MSDLKKYLQYECKMPEHREVEEFALEMLKTTKSNLEYHQMRTRSLIASEDLGRHAKDAIQQAETLLEIAKLLVTAEGRLA